MLVASFAMSNGDCLEGRHSVKEPLILGQLWAISTLQHINAGMVMMMSTTTTMTVAMMVTTLVLENCAKCFSKIFEANFYGNGSWTKSSLCSLMLSHKEETGTSIWVIGSPGTWWWNYVFQPCKWVSFLFWNLFCNLMTYYDPISLKKKEKKLKQIIVSQTDPYGHTMSCNFMPFKLFL